MAAKIIRLADKSARVSMLAARISAMRLASELLFQTRGQEGFSVQELSQKSGVPADEIEAIEARSGQINAPQDLENLPEIPVASLVSLFAAMGFELKILAHPKAGGPKNPHL